MSQESDYQQVAGRARRLVRGLALTVVGLLALASCGPNSGAGAPAPSNSAPSAGPSAASTSVLAAGPALAPAAPACPKLVEPKCPVAPGAAPGVASKPLSARTAAIWSGAGRRGWRRHGHRYPYAQAARRWDEGRPWPGDRPGGDQMGGERDRRGDLMGGPRLGQSGGYRAEEDTRRTERSEFSSAYGGERFVERDREEVHGARPCPLDCRGGLPGDWRGGGYRAAGIDERGYLVWPGKVEY